MQTESFDVDAWGRQAMAGDPDAFSRLIEKYQPRIFAMAWRLLENRCDAEDVLQDSFLAMYRHRESFQYRSRISTWMYAIVLNRVRNHLRHARVKRWSSLDALIETEDGEQVVEFPDNEEGVEASVARKLVREDLERAAAALPESYQVIFRMHYFDDTPLAEIAERLGRPLGTVKAYLHRARKLLVERLQQSNDLRELSGALS